MDLNISHANVVMMSLAVGAFARPYLIKALDAFPNWLVTYEKKRFDAAVASGKISPRAARLARALKRAVITWADEEMPNVLGEDKMEKAIVCLGNLPYISALVAADPQMVRDALQAEYNALRAEVKQEAASDAPKNP